MKAGRMIFALLIAMAASPPAAADFNAIARRIETTQHVRRNWIPFVGIGRVFVRMAKPGGVHDFKVAIFDDGRISADADLDSIVLEELDPGWHQVIRSRSKRDGERATIWARDAGATVRMLILSQESDETVLLEVAVDPETFVIGLHDPASMKDIGDGRPMTEDR